METKVYGQDPFMLHVRIGSVVITQILAGHNDASFEAYLIALDRELTERPSTDRVAVVYYVPAGGTWGAVQRSRINQVLERHVVKRRKTTSVWIMCTPSAATRGVVTALFWISKPPYEYRMHATLAAALEEIRGFNPEISPRAIEAEMDRLVRGH